MPKYGYGPVKLYSQVDGGQNSAYSQVRLYSVESFFFKKHMVSNHVYPLGFMNSAHDIEIAAFSTKQNFMLRSGVNSFMAQVL